MRGLLLDSLVLGGVVCATLSPSAASADYWSGPLAFGVQATHMIQLKSGNLLLWDNGVSPSTGSASRSPYAMVVKIPPGKDLAQFPSSLDDPSRAEWIEQVPLVVPGLHTNLFCSAHLQLDDKDGSVFVTGGDRYHYRGIQRQWLFREGTPSTWTRLPDMSLGKWYPEPTMLPGGSILVTMGSAEFEAPGLYPEETPSKSYEFLYLDMASLADLGNVAAHVGSVPFQRTEWFWQETTPQHIYFPALYPLDMETFWAAGSRYDSRKFSLLDSEFEFYRFPAEPGIGFETPPVYPSVAFVDLGDKRIAFKAGGSFLTTPAVTNLAMINLDSESPEWAAGPPMNAPRKNHFLMVLPTGDLMAIGGNYVNLWDYDSSSAPQRSPEILTPVDGDYTAGTWKSMAPSQYHRPYHHTVSLLPDGRILCAGGEPTETFNGQYYADIYTPDYAIGDRPEILSGPETVFYDETVEIEANVLGRKSVESLCMIPLSTATHARLFGQRYNKLTIKKVAESHRGAVSISFQTPLNEARAQMGWYMLFLVDSDGKVSKSKIIRLTSRFSRQFPTSIASIGATSATGSVTDILQGDGCVDNGTRKGEYTVTKSGNGPVTIRLATRFHEGCLPLESIRIRLEVQRIGGDIAAPTVFAGVPGGQKFELESIQGGSLHSPRLTPFLDIATMRRKDNGSMDALADAEGRIEVDLVYEFSNSSLRVDEFQVGGYQKTAP